MILFGHIKIMDATNGDKIRIQRKGHDSDQEGLARYWRTARKKGGAGKRRKDCGIKEETEDPPSLDL
jgi:hypothetical protein